MPEPETIVIVEDDCGLREALERVLRAAGFRTAAFCSAETLLETGGAEGAACLVFDVQLPGVSGLELFRRLSAVGPQPPVIFITAYDQPRTRAEAGRLGAMAYFTKPFLGKQLVRAVIAALGSGTRETFQ